MTGSVSVPEFSATELAAFAGSATLEFNATSANVTFALDYTHSSTGLAIVGTGIFSIPMASGPRPPQLSVNVTLGGGSSIAGTLTACFTADQCQGEVGNALYDHGHHWYEHGPANNVSHIRNMAALTVPQLCPNGKPKLLVEAHAREWAFDDLELTDAALNLACCGSSCNISAMATLAISDSFNATAHITILTSGHKDVFLSFAYHSGLVALTGYLDYAKGDLAGTLYTAVGQVEGSLSAGF
jgi:hypothetical protein